MPSHTETRITIRLPARVVRALDQRARVRGVNRCVIIRWYLELVLDRSSRGGTVPASHSGRPHDPGPGTAPHSPPED